MDQYYYYNRLLPSTSASSTSSTSSSSSSTITITSLFLALLCPIFVVILSLYLKLNIATKIIVAVVRTIVQLLLAGYLLLGFIFDLSNPIAVVSYLVMMAFIATIEVTSRTSRVYANQFRDAFISVCASGGLIGAFGSIIVFNPSPWYKPNIVVPTGGMIIGNAISGPALAVEKILAEVSEKTYEFECRLAFGSTAYESVLPSIRSALLQALTPNLNQMAVVGLVSIPGMMTGQLLGGASPLTAALYQMAILWLICGTAALSTWIALYLAIIGAVFDENHRLTPHRITKKAKKTGGIDKILYQAFETIYLFITSLIRQIIRKVRPPFGDIESTTRKEYELVKTENMESDDLEVASTMEVKVTSPIASLNNEGIPPVGTPEKPINPCNYKVTYEFMSQLSLESNEEPFFEINKLNVRSEDKLLFDDSSGISFNLRRGERICIEGPSGIGKTRMLRAIAKLDDLQSGSISFLGAIESYSVPKWRSRCTYIPQALPPMEGTPKDLVREACGYRSRENRKGSMELLKNFDELCGNAANSVGLEASKMDQLWRDLSGGERQRALICSALLLAKGKSSIFIIMLIILTVQF